MNGSNDSWRSVFSLLFISSLASLAFELSLTRIFSITLSYHFAFMVVSIAMLGIGAGGTVLSIRSGLVKAEMLPVFGILLATAFPISYLIANALPFDPARFSWDRFQIFYLGLTCLVLAMPFFFFGLLALSLYALYPDRSGQVYAADLLGAGCGSILIFLVLSAGGPENAPFLASLVVSAILAVLIRGTMRAAVLVLILLDSAMLFLHPAIIDPSISPYKPLESALRFPGARRLAVSYDPSSRIDVFESPAVRYAPGLSLRYFDPLPNQTGIAVDGGDLHAFTDERDKSKLGFLRHLPSSLPFLLGQGGPALILEPRGGLPVLVGKEYGSRPVVALESNQHLVRIVKGIAGPQGASSAADILASGIGRSWLSTTDRLFRVIDISTLGAMPAGSFGFSEDYRFTIEAFSAYLRHLEPEGLLSVSLYLAPPPRSDLRVLATLAKAAERLGIEDISSRLAIIRSWDTVTLILKRSELTREEIETIRTFCKARLFDTVFLPGMNIAEANRHITMPDNSYAETIREMVDPQLRALILENYPFDIKPRTDDSPFFHYHLKWRSIGVIYKMTGDKWQYFLEEGYLLPVLFLLLLILSACLVLAPVLVMRRTKDRRSCGKHVLLLAVFGCLGIAYLFVEIACIQQMILPLQEPTLAAGVVIASLLAGSGAGSIVASRRNSHRVLSAPLMLAFLIIASMFFLPKCAHLLIPLSKTLRISVSFLIFLPLGFLMGMPFPLAMTILGQKAPGLVPWAWAVNGCCSVLSPVLAVMMAITAGYSAVMAAASAAYLASFVLLGTMMNLDVFRPGPSGPVELHRS